MNQSFSENASKNTTKKCFVLPIISFYFSSCLNDAGTFPSHRRANFLPGGGGNDSQEHGASPVTPHLANIIKNSVVLYAGPLQSVTLFISS